MSDTKKPSDTKEKPKSSINNIDELSSFVYNGNKHGNHYNWTTRALADYCSSRMYPGVWELIMDGTEATFDEPQETSGKPTELQKVKYSWEVNQWLKAKEDYRRDKAKITIIIRSLCIQSFRNTIEGHGTYAKLCYDDVAGLLKLIHEVTFNSTTATQYGPMLALTGINNILKT
jgi:hypothetical protein